MNLQKEKELPLNLKFLKMPEIFQFKQFSVLQNSNVFKVGTDGVLAGVLADIHSSKNILDVGCGTGLMSLICAQRNQSANITAIDLDETAADLSDYNFKNSIFSERIKCFCTDFKNFSSEEKYDYIISNPPYFKPTEQLHLKHAKARQQLNINYEQFFSNAYLLLEEQGVIGLIFPFIDEEKIIKTATDYHLYLKRSVHISGIKNGKTKRSFLEFSKEKKAVKYSEFYIEEAPRIQSGYYKKITQDFYL